MIAERRWRTRLLAGPGNPVAVQPRERELWIQVTEAERIREAAPPAPSSADLLAAREAVTHALVLQEKVARQAALVEEALRRPMAWLRPVHRFRLLGQLHSRRVAADATRDRLDRAQARFAELRRQAAHRRDYLAAHAETLAAARTARAELDQRIDEVIDRYLRMTNPPVWFRFGVGAPPGPEQQAEWLGRAREEVARRRRYGAG